MAQYPVLPLLVPKEQVFYGPLSFHQAQDLEVLLRFLDLMHHQALAPLRVSEAHLINPILV